MNWAGNTMADLCEANVHRTDRLAEYRVGDQIIQRDSNIRVIYIMKDHLGSCGNKLLEHNGLWRYEETTPFGQTVMSGYRQGSWATSSEVPVRLRPVVRLGVRSGVRSGVERRPSAASSAWAVLASACHLGSKPMRR